MPTTDQKADLLFKKYLGKGSSGTSSFYFNEPLDGRSTVFPIQIWADQSLIPISASTVVGITEKLTDITLTPVAGQQFAFYDEQLKDAIPFNYDFSGSYVPTVKTNAGSIIAFGQNDWVIDIETGMLTFYSGLPVGVSNLLPPKITFWKYIGQRGFTIPDTASYSDTASWALTSSWALNTITASYTEWARYASSSLYSIESQISSHSIVSDSAESSSYASTSQISNTASISLYSKTASFLGNQYGGGAAQGTASYALTSNSSIYSDTASYAYYAQVTLGTASYSIFAEHSNTSTQADHATTADNSTNAISASFLVGNVEYATSAGYSLRSDTSSYSILSENSTHSETSSYSILSENTRFTASYSIRGDFAFTASYSHLAVVSLDSISSSYAYTAQITLGTSSHALTADYSTNSGYANTAGHSNSSISSSAADWAFNSTFSDTASHIQLAESASYAHYAQVVLGTSSYALDSGHAESSSYAQTSSFTISSSHADRANYTYGTASYSDTGTHAFTASYISGSGSWVSYSESASYSRYADITLGTSSYALTASIAQHVNLADSSSYSFYSVTSSFSENSQYSNTSASSSYSDKSGFSDTAYYSNFSAYATHADTADNALVATSSNFALDASHSISSSYSEYSSTASYALTASYFLGTASGSIINIGTPTDGYYGSGSNGNIAGISAGDKMEDALDKLDSILDKLVPSKPPALNTKTFSLTSQYTARKAGTNTSYTTITDIQFPTFQLVGGMIPANSFSDGNNGILTALIDGIDIGNKVLTSIDDTGTYGGLQITGDSDYYIGQSGKAGFWYSILAQINVQSSIDDDLPHTASMSHTLTGTSTPSYFYIDNPATPSIISSAVSASGLVYISGVPAYVGGVSSSNVTLFSTSSFGFTWRFYNNTRVFAGSGTGITTTNFTLPSSPSAGSIISGSLVVSINSGVTSENAAYVITAYNSKGTTATYNISNTYYRLDSTLDTSNRVTSGIGQYPSTNYGTAFDASINISGSSNEELQMLNGQYRYPVGNYSAALPVSGPNYTSVPLGIYNSMRWVTLNLGTVSAASNLTLTITSPTNFNGGGLPISSFALYVRVNGATSTNGWIDGNVAYPGVGSPTNNGDPALVVANSTSTVKVVTFGSVTKTGTVFVRIGIPVGDNKRFLNITMTSA